MDRLATLLIQFGTLAAAVWGTLQILPPRKGSNAYKLPLSFVLGGVFGMLGHAFGMVDPLAGLAAHEGHEVGHLLDTVDRIQHWGGSAFLGILSTVMAKVAHDKLLGPMLSKAAEKKDG